MGSNTATGNSELRHGYTLASLDGLARKAVLESHWRFLSFRDRYDIAFGAIAEHLYASDETPRPHDLIRLGDRAIRLYVDEESHWSGRYIYRTGVPEIPRFRLYWLDTSSTTSSSPEERVVEKTAFDQVWKRLTPLHQRVLLALAAHEDYTRAAKSLGLTRKSFVTYVYLARKQFFRLWHDTETPSGIWGRHRPNHQQRRSATLVLRRRDARRRKRGEEGDIQRC